MSLEQKTFKANNAETKDYDEVHFIPVIVDDKEVYEVRNSSNLHCGYVTEAFLEALIKVSDEDGKLNGNFIVKQAPEWAGDMSLSRGGDITLLSRKIILDAPKDPRKILVQGIVLRPTIYPEETEKDNKALTIATNGCFRIISSFCPLDIKVNHDFIEAESFSIVRVGGSHDKSVTIDLDLATNRVGDLNIDGLYGESAFGGPYLKLKCTNEEIAPDITISDYTINGNTNDKNETGYIHFETAGEFSAKDGAFDMPTFDKMNRKEPCKVISNEGDIYFESSNLRFENKDGLDSPSLVVKNAIVMKNTDALISGKNNIDGQFRSDPTARQNKMSSLWMDSITSNSGILLEAKSSKECTFRLKDSYFENEEKNIKIRGNSSLVGVVIDNSMRSKELVLENVNLRYSILKDISNLKEAEISNSEVENLNLSNKSKMNKPFCFSFGSLSYSGINFFYKTDQSEVDKTIYSSIKNIDVSLWEKDQFLDKVGKGLHITNSNIQGNFWIETECIDQNATIPLNMNNSVLTRGFLHISRDANDNNSPISISNSEIVGRVTAANLDLIDSSIIKGKVVLNQVRTIKNAMIDQVSFEDGSVASIDGDSYFASYDSAEQKDVQKSKSTEDLELL